MTPRPLPRRKFLRSATLLGAVPALSGVSRAVDDPTGISLGQTVQGRIDEDDPYSPGYGAPYYAEDVTFEGTEGQTVRIVEESPDFSPFLEVKGPGGGFLTTESGDGSSATAELTLPSDGEYTIWAETWSGNAFGQFTLSLELVGGDDGSQDGQTEQEEGDDQNEESSGDVPEDIDSISYGEKKSAKIDSDDPSDAKYANYQAEKVAFSGTEGDTATITMAPESVQGTWITVTNPDGDVLVSTGQGDQQTTVTLTLDQSGEYHIYAGQYDANEYGTFSLELAGDGSGSGGQGSDGSDEQEGEEDEGDSAEYLRGEVLTVDGDSVSDATVELWEKPADVDNNTDSTVTKNRIALTTTDFDGRFAFDGNGDGQTIGQSQASDLQAQYDDVLLMAKRDDWLTTEAVSADTLFGDLTYGSVTLDREVLFGPESTYGTKSRASAWRRLDSDGNTEAILVEAATESGMNEVALSVALPEDVEVKYPSGYGGGNAVRARAYDFDPGSYTQRRAIKKFAPGELGVPAYSLVGHLYDQPSTELPFDSETVGIIETLLSELGPAKASLAAAIQKTIIDLGNLFDDESVKTIGQTGESLDRNEYDIVKRATSNDAPGVATSSFVLVVPVESIDDVTCFARGAWAERDSLADTPVDFGVELQIDEDSTGPA